MVPEVEIAIADAETSVVQTASDSEYLRAANFLSPYDLVGLNVDYS